MLERFGFGVLVAGTVAWSIGPFAWTIWCSVVPEAALMTRPVQWVPGRFVLDHYRALLGGPSGSIAAMEFPRAAANSLIVGLVTTMLALLLGAAAAYALSRGPERGVRFRGLLLVVLLIQLLPAVALLIPLYIFLARVGLTDRLAGLVVVYLTFSLPFAIWMLKSYFDTIPPDLELAAMVDGCTPLQALWRVVVPVAAPGVAATAIFTLLQVWNEFFFAVVFTSSLASKTVPVVVAEFGGRFTLEYGLMNASAVLGSAVPLGLALIFQRWILAGLASGGIKG